MRNLRSGAFDHHEAAAPEATRPAACPACGSKNLTTTSKAITVASYWRCVACGEIWNAERLGSGGRGWRPYR
ncbi:MAG TPA: hypothetical protein VK886_16880 [Vicinamibacterales bacterium]|nr:hypothetical protein [Vicinamibacterales bacterium]